MQRPEKYKENFDVLSEGSSSGSYRGNTIPTGRGGGTICCDTEAV
jgi:hypothetical protein